MDKNTLKEAITLCPACDLVVNKQPLHPGLRAICPRCHTKLYDTPYCSINGMFALCITAVLLYIPANFYPVLELHFFGSIRTTTIMGAAIMVSHQGYWVVGLAVIVAAVIGPGLLVLSILAQVLILKYGFNKPFFHEMYKQLLRQHKLISQLTMLEIYIISVFVVVFQLSGYTDLYFGLGTFSSIMLFIIVLFLQREYHTDYMWGMLNG